MNGQQKGQHTSKAEENPIICPYSACLVDNRPDKYWIQWLFLIVSWLSLIKSGNDFNQTTIFLFMIPIWIDLYFSQKCTGLARLIQLLFYGIAIVIFLLVCSCMVGYVSGDGTFFTVANGSSILGYGKSISKSAVSKGLFIETFYPLSLYLGAPSNQDYMLAKWLLNFKR